MNRKNRKSLMGKIALATTTGLLISSLSLQAKENKENKLAAYIKFSQILNLVESQYVDDLNTTTLITKSLKGLMSNLDPHSVYMDAKAFKSLNVQTKGEFGGLGIVVGMKDGALTVISPIDGTPAFRAGIKAGDIILKIDDESTIGISINDAVKLMRGKPKTKIKLTIVRKGASHPLVIPIIRGIIKIESVKAKTIGKDILYIRVASFDSKVVKGVKKALLTHPNAKGIIIDLRNNPGGLLNQAVGMLDLFINKGTLVSQKGRTKDENAIYSAKKANTINSHIPIVTLVNGGSASASEIVSGALQDTHRARIVGKKTFGKGSVQVIVPIGHGEGIKLTVARYYLPSGRTIQNKGVTPDIIVGSGVIKRDDNNTISLKERNLKKHLKVELAAVNHKVADNNTSSENNSTKKDKSIITDDQLYKDAQLKSATNILDALILTEKQRKEK